MVPEAGLEPARFLRRGILNPVCLPISPLWHKLLAAKVHCARLVNGSVDLPSMQFISLMVGHGLFESRQIAQSQSATNFTTLA